MLGYAFMGKAHSNAFRKIAYITWPPSLEPELIGIAGRNEEAVGEAARRYGWEYATTDWRDLIADDRIGLFDNGGPNSLHARTRATRSGRRWPRPASGTCAPSTTASCRQSGSRAS
jgi:predicted dehydrogenase